jgi:prepilin-type N-terminal cleavage/methylation domain-containing protein
MEASVILGNSMHKTSYGFSLVELSIVLAVIGLLVGGVLSAQSLIRSAEIRNTVGELSRYQDAYGNFRKKYQSVPGDMSDATSIWEIRAGSTGNDDSCRRAPGIYTGTCNGNGDNMIDETGGNNLNTVFERYLFWQHLALSGMIDGRFTGATADSSPLTRAVGFNLPKSALGNNNGLEPVWLSGSISSNPQFFDGSYNVNVLVFTNNGLTPEEAWSIDTKIDDGVPATGAVFSLKASSTWSPNCTTSDVVATAQYNLTLKSKACNVWMELQ